MNYAASRWILITLLVVTPLVVHAQTHGIVDLNNLANYANQPVLSYITKNNTSANNPLTNAGATRGRVLFYDKQLSADNTIACSSCHLQQHAFGDPDQASMGVNGITGRHSMRLVNMRFAVKDRFFWDERAALLEEQSTMPIHDHVEMGFSGDDGDPAFDSLLNKMADLERYSILFDFVYGDSDITEERMQLALSQFMRSIQSFDSRFDDGLAQAGDLQAPFSNFSAAENEGKQLFLGTPAFDSSGIARPAAWAVQAVISHQNSTSNSTPGTMALPKV